ncbi:MAG: GIY-YIG nuclease family protein [Verrucomicrobia bacterium]|nr:GIY-YIG nuclease family protein [Verrucomicrobiota bacterium]MBU1910691.1 GIY-YIG nuclease family protein [Verrucomicrobiota bacterium]
MAKWYTYILECMDGSYYVGITTDLSRRLDMHNAGVASRWTRTRRPVQYRYAEACKSQSEARKREIEIKAWRREKKAALFNLPVNIFPI